MLTIPFKATRTAARVAEPRVDLSNHSGDRMDIALICEGTYPFYAGGVSVWCDQLIRGLPEHRFHVHALTASGLEPVTWETPDNLVSMTITPLWRQQLAMRPAKFTSSAFETAHWDFVNAMVQPDAPWAAHQYATSLRALFDYAQTADLASALLSNASLDRMMTAWRLVRSTAGPNTLERDMTLEPSLADALTASDLLAHFLQPLSAVPMKVDLCHAVSNGLSALVALASRWTYNTPFILTEHGVYLRERYLSYLDAPYSQPVRSLILNFYRHLSNTAYRAADLVTPVCEFNRRWALRNGANASRVRPVYNGVDTDEFVPTTTEPLVPTISFLGRIDPLKDIHTLIRAFAIVREAIPNAELRMFGPTPEGNEAYRDSCLDLIQSLGLDGVARLEGRARAIDGYHAGQVVALTSISEGFPYALIEAMAAGRPVIATDVGGVTEAVGEAGIIVAPRDYQGVATACIELLNDETLRRTLGEAARTRALSLFAVEKFLDIYRNIYPEVASGAWVQQSTRSQLTGSMGGSNERQNRIPA